MFSIFRKEEDIQNKCYKLNSLLDLIEFSSDPGYSMPKRLTANTLLLLEQTPSSNWNEIEEYLNVDVLIRTLKDLSNKEDKPYMTKYYSLEYDGMKAKYRMKEWWNRDKNSMLKSYLYYKPVQNFYTYFYWDTVLNVSSDTLSKIRKVEIILFLVSSLLILFDKKKIKEWLFLMLVYASQIALYSYTFAFSRYAISMFFMRNIIIGLGIGIIYDILKKRRLKYESINDNSGL